MNTHIPVRPALVEGHFSRCSWFDRCTTNSDRLFLNDKRESVSGAALNPFPSFRLRLSKPLILLAGAVLSCLFYLAPAANTQELTEHPPVEQPAPVTNAQEPTEHPPAEQKPAAQALTGTLKKIRESGVIVLGYREAAIPFSYTDMVHGPVGYTLDLCERIVEVIKVKLHMPRLGVEYRLVMPNERIPLLKNGVIDLECGSTTNSIERQQEVSFSVNYFIANLRMGARKDAGIHDFSSLAGKSIVTTTGTSSVQWLEQEQALKNQHVKILYGRSLNESFLMVRSGRAAALVLDDVLLAGLIAHAKDPNAYEIVGSALHAKPYAIVMRKGDAPLKKIVDQTLSTLMKSGEAGKLYNRWFMSPIPPRDINLNLPMSDALKSAFAHPTDKGSE
jgi:glutamate/aspartate transport system substrate-binding protein